MRYLVVGSDDVVAVDVVGWKTVCRTPQRAGPVVGCLTAMASSVLVLSVFPLYTHTAILTRPPWYSA